MTNTPSSSPNSNKKFQLFFIKFLERLVIIIPLLMVVFFVWYQSWHLKTNVGMVNDPLFQDSGAVIWKMARNFFLYVYLGIGGVAIFLFESIKPTDWKSRKKFILRMFIGYVLLNFSYAISLIVIDFCWVSYYFYLSASGQGNLLRNH